MPFLPKMTIFRQKILKLKTKWKKINHTVCLIGHKFVDFHKDHKFLPSKIRFFLFDEKYSLLKFYLIENRTIHKGCILFLNRDVNENFLQVFDHKCDKTGS